MNAKKSLFLMSLIGAFPGGLLAFFGVVGGISGASGMLQILYFLAAGLGVVISCLPLTVMAGVFPKFSSQPKATAPAKVADKPAKKAKPSESDEAESSDEIGEAASDDEFAVVDDDEFDAGSDDLAFEEEEEEK